MSWGYVAVAAATVVAGAMSSNAAGDASRDAINAQTSASDRQIAEARRQFDTVREDTRLARETGNDALLTLGFLLGVRPAPSDEKIAKLKTRLAEMKEMRLESAAVNARGAADQQKSSVPGKFGGGAGGSADSPDGAIPAASADIGAIDASIDKITARLDEAKRLRQISKKYEGGLGEYIRSQPGYEFGLNEGMNAVTNTLSAAGQGQGGKAIKSAARFGIDYAGSKTDEHLGRLLTLAGMGPVAANTSAGAGQNLANTVANATNANARVIGDAAYGNAAVNIGATNNMLNTGLSLWSYNNMMRTPQSSNLMTVPQGSTPTNIRGTA